MKICKDVEMKNKNIKQKIVKYSYPLKFRKVNIILQYWMERNTTRMSQNVMMKQMRLEKYYCLLALIGEGKFDRF